MRDISHLDDHLSHEILLHHDVATNQLLHHTRQLTASEKMFYVRRHLYTTHRQ